MDKKRVELTVVGFLLMVLVITFANSIVKIRPRAAMKGKDQPSPALQEAGEYLFRTKASVQKGRLTEEKTLWGRDPFMLHGSADAEAASAENLKLMGITIGKNSKPIAIINDQLVGPGSKIGKFRILKVFPTKVIVSDGEKTFELEMK